MENTENTNNNKSKTNLNVIKFLTGQTFSLFGSSIVQYAIIWYIVIKTSSGAMITISTICGFVPQLIISFFSGVWLDRYNRKMLMIVSDGVIALSTLILAIMFIYGKENMFMLFLILAIRSAGTGIQNPAVHSVIAQITAKESLTKINAINSTINSLTVFLSPAISGLIMSISKIETTLFIDVITAVIGISITLTVKIPSIIKTKISSSHIQDIKESINFLKENPLIKNILLFIVVIAVLISPSAFLTPIMISKSFGKEVWRLTLSEMTFSLGATLGGILIVTFGSLKKRSFSTLLAGAFYGLFMICLSTTPYLTYFGANKAYAVYLIFNLLIGITLPYYNTPITTTIQQEVPENMHGRIFSFLQISNSVALPLGMIIFGPISDIITVEKLLTINGILVLICVLFTFKNKYFEIKKISLK